MSLATSESIGRRDGDAMQDTVVRRLMLPRDTDGAVASGGKGVV